MYVFVTHTHMCQHDTSLISSQTMHPIHKPNTWQGWYVHEEQAYEVWSQSHEFLKNKTDTCMCQP